MKRGVGPPFFYARCPATFNFIPIKILLNMKRFFNLLLVLMTAGAVYAQPANRALFNQDWKFILGDDPAASQPGYDDAKWRKLDLPHDWSIELPFDSTSPTGNGGGALRGGIGWYRKSFRLPAAAANRKIFVTFDGIYRKSEVWINGHSLGKRPYGYSSFQYDLTPYLQFGSAVNVIAVRADNGDQPNSRWYSGSGIYRNVWLTVSEKAYVVYNGTYITTPVVEAAKAEVKAVISVKNENAARQDLRIVTRIVSPSGTTMATATAMVSASPGQEISAEQQFNLSNPQLWSVSSPLLYRAVTTVSSGSASREVYSTRFGIRYFSFDADKGFSLNGRPVKINGVCDHHDLGCLGAAINTSALRRQLQILREMGCNGIRTSHNPPAPELLDLCDEMGFIVMDEAFDMWKKEKTKFDYHLDWEAWHRKDLEDQIIRDRNHPSVFVWSIGNEVIEQWDQKDNSGAAIATELAGIVRSLDATRPITAACNSPYPNNPVIRSGALDLIGYNYEHRNYPSFHERFPGKKFIGTETVSSLATRGHYDMPADSIRRWPLAWDKEFRTGNPDLTVSAYDNVSAPWGSTQEETWKIIRKFDFLSGQYIWTGFDYIGEPTPYPWPARSSYFGIIDLAGFPKDTYYMYQSEWTSQPVLHLFPHWNWKPGTTVDLWAYYNNADEVELFLNGKSLGTKRKGADDLHVAWQVAFEPGTLKAVSRKNGKTVLTREIYTAGPAYRIVAQPDRKTIRVKDNELCFVSVTIVDRAGNPVPDAANLVKFQLTGPGSIAGVDNGCQTDLSSFKANEKKAFNGKCLAVVQSAKRTGPIRLQATAEGLMPATVLITAN